MLLETAETLCMTFKTTDLDNFDQTWHKVSLNQGDSNCLEKKNFRRGDY